MMTRELYAELFQAAQEAVDSKNISVDDIDAALTANWRTRMQLEIEWRLMYDRLDRHFRALKKAKESIEPMPDNIRRAI
jgi:hypothetical protein